MIIEETYRQFRDATMLMQGHTDTLEEKVRLDDLESSDRKFEFRATKKEPDAVLNIREGAALANVDMSTFAREAVAAALERIKAGLPIRGLQITAETGTDAFRAPALGSVPCGPLAPAVAEASDLVSSAQDADELEARPGDIWMRAAGDSMLGAGIADGVRVLTRPYDENKAPRRGDIVVAQIETPDGQRVGTIKRYLGEQDGRPRLVDGNEEPYALPDDMVTINYVARVVSVLGRVG